MFARSVGVAAYLLLVTGATLIRSNCNLHAPAEWAGRCFFFIHFWIELKGFWYYSTLYLDNFHNSVKLCERFESEMTYFPNIMYNSSIDEKASSWRGSHAPGQGGVKDQVPVWKMKWGWVVKKTWRKNHPVCRIACRGGKSSGDLQPLHYYLLHVLPVRLHTKFSTRDSEISLNKSLTQ